MSHMMIVTLVGLALCGLLVIVFDSLDMLDGNAEYDHNCGNCAWHDSFTWACLSDLSEHRTDYTAVEDCCDAWEKKTDDQND